MKKRRSYPAFMRVNGVLVNEILIDSHYQKKHSGYMSDELILELVDLLKMEQFRLDSRSGRFSYFVFDGVFLRERYYRLILLMEQGENYLGVVNAFRV